MSATDFIGIEKQPRIKLGAVPALAHEVSDAPGDNHEQCQRPFNALDGLQLQPLDFAAFLEDVEIDFDFQRVLYQSINSTVWASVGAARLVNKRHSTGLTSSRAPISRATTHVAVMRPFLPSGISTTRVHSCWRIGRAFTPCRDAMVKVNSPSASPDVVRSHNLQLSSSGTQRLCLSRTSQWLGCRARARKASSHPDRLRGRRDTPAGYRASGRHLGDPLVAFNPARAFLFAAAHAVGITFFARPHPRVEHAQRLTPGRDSVGRMQIHAAPCFVVQRPEPLDILAMEVQFGRVLYAQHDRVRARPVRCPDVAPLDVVIAQEAVCRTGFAPAIARIRNAGRRVRRKSFHQNLRPFVEPTIAKIEPYKLLIRPALLRYLSQCITQNPRVNVISSEFTTPAATH